MQYIIADQIAFYLSWYVKDANNEANNQIIRQAARARIAIFKTAPRDIPLLEIEITKKTKTFNTCETYPGREILLVELDTLKWVLTMVRINLDQPSVDPAESNRKDMGKWRALLSIKD